jgi:hypothetical protein
MKLKKEIKGIEQIRRLWKVNKGQTSSRKAREPGKGSRKIDIEAAEDQGRNQGNGANRKVKEVKEGRRRIERMQKRVESKADRQAFILVRIGCLS